MPKGKTRPWRPLWLLMPRESGTLRFLQLPLPPSWSQKPNAGSVGFKAPASRFSQLKSPLKGRDKQWGDPVERQTTN